MINTPVWILWITLLIGFQPEKQGIDPEDAILFQDLEEDVTQGKSISNGSWLRYMEYGDVSVLTKASARTSSSSTTLPLPTEESIDLSDTTHKERIEKSFTHTPLVHKEKKDVVAEEVWEVLPDENCCCFEYGLVVWIDWIETKE